MGRHTNFLNSGYTCTQLCGDGAALSEAKSAISLDLILKSARQVELFLVILVLVMS